MDDEPYSYNIKLKVSKVAFLMCVCGMIEHMEGAGGPFLFLPAALSEASGIGMTIQPSPYPLPNLNFFIDVSDHFFFGKKSFEVFY
jgi:hypothetical protein